MRRLATLDISAIVRMLMSGESCGTRTGMRRVAGVDVGGTFTDLLLYEVGPEGERVRLAKILTTSANQADGVLAAIAQAGVCPRDLDLVIHGTTTTTNAVLEAFREAKITKTELARRIGKDEKEVRRILDPRHATKLAALTQTLHALGRRLVIAVEKAA